MNCLRALQRLTACFCTLLLAGCGPSTPSGSSTGGTQSNSQHSESGFRVTSAAFDYGKPIPIQYAGDGDNISPPLVWEGFPENVVSFAVICEDADAAGGARMQWGIYNIPATATGLPEATPSGAQIPGGVRQAMNDFGQNAYGGPAPPRGRPHRYQFKVYALDSLITLPSSNAPVSALADALEGHVLAEALLEGTYTR